MLGIFRRALRTMLSIPLSHCDVMLQTPVRAISLVSDDELPFHGYREPDPSGHGFLKGDGQIYFTIQHFYESERFRGVDEALRRLVMSMPTAREARKTAMQNATRIRADWPEVHERIMACAVWMKMRERPEYAKALVANPDLAREAYPFLDKHWSNRRPGVTLNRYELLLLQIRDQLLRGTMRVAIVGSRGPWNPFLFQSKVDFLFRRAKPDVLLLGPHKGIDEIATAWAIANLVPVRYLPAKSKPGRSERERQNKEFLRAATHAVVFSRGDVDTLAFIEAAKAVGRPVKLVSVDANGRPLRGS